MVYRVAVLTEDNQTDYDILRELGTIDLSDKKLCPSLYEKKQKETLLFKYTEFGLFERTAIIDDHLLRANGAIAIFNYSPLNRNRDKFRLRLSAIGCAPLLVIVQNCPVEYSTGHFSDTYYHVVYIPEKVYPRIEGCYEAINMWLVNSMEEKKRKPTIYNSLPNYAYSSPDALSNNMLMRLFEGHKLSPDKWNHYCRLRFIFMSLRYYGYANTIDMNGWLCTHWRKQSSKTWNYSLIRLWIEQILLCIKAFDEAPCIFSALYYGNSHLGDAKLHVAYYTSDVLNSDKAKNSYVAPNNLPQSQCAVS